MSFIKPPQITYCFNPEEKDPELRNEVVLRKLTWRQRETIKNSGADMAFNARLSELQAINAATGESLSDPEIAMKFDMQIGKELLLKYCIASWSGPEFDGPCTDDNKINLAPEIAEILLKEIDKLNMGLTEQEKKVSTSRSNHSS